MSASVCLPMLVPVHVQEKVLMCRHLCAFPRSYLCACVRGCVHMCVFVFAHRCASAQICTFETCK